MTSRLFSIPSGANFADELAAGLRARFAEDGGAFGLADALVFLPTRRAIRSVEDAFAANASAPGVLLPRFHALGDWDADEDEAGDPSTLDGRAPTPPPLAPLERTLALMNMVMAWDAKHARAGERPPRDPALALGLAQDLAALFDAAALERMDWAKLRDLAPVEMAKHWEQTLEFLKILTEEWPQWLAGQNRSDPGHYRDRQLTELAQRWTAHPPSHPVVIAGSTGSVKATADLMAAVLKMPKGAVILPGLDLQLDEDAWSVLGPDHPQFVMKELLTRLDYTRRDVEAWTEALGTPARAELLRETMRPAAAAGAWAGFAARAKDQAGAMIDGMSAMESDNPNAEAAAIALAMREAVEAPDKTVALITPNRNLARRVAADMRRWGLDVDDSAGRPLSKTPLGAFLSLAAGAAAEDFAPIPLLALLKHPFATLGWPAGRLRAAVTRLELDVLRGPRPEAGLDGLARVCSGEARDLVAQLAEFFAPHLAHMTISTNSSPTARGGSPAERGEGGKPTERSLAAFPPPASPHSPQHVGGRIQVEHSFSTDLGGEAGLRAWARSHRAAAEALSQGSPFDPWTDEAGAAACALFDEIDAAEFFAATLTFPAYARVIDGLMDARAVRLRRAASARAAILGPLEARLQRADVVILGGLNEPGWPAAAHVDGWINRPMRRDLDLSQPERRIGQSAHDFVEAACAPRVILSRARKEEGGPANPSRWLVRLNALTKALGVDEALNASPYPAWARLLDRPETYIKIEPPNPTPPVVARPRKLFVTQVEQWVRDPYAHYVKQILNLRPLDPIDQDPSAREKGNFIHRALELFVKAFPRDLPADAEAQLEAFGREAAQEMKLPPAVMTVWRPRFQKIVRWIIALERVRRPLIAEVLSEVSGQVVLTDANFTLSAKADRIEIWRDGGVAVLDYKTGAVPTQKEIHAGLSPQFPLEAWIAREGGFPGVAPRETPEFLALRLTGAREGGEIKTYKDGAELVARAAAGLKQRIAQFDDPATGYPSKVAVKFQRAAGDFDYIARSAETALDEETPPE